MTLGEQQRLFVQLVGQLIAWAYTQGYELTFGEAWRSAHEIAWDASQGIGSPKSLHGIRLAVDLNLFKAGVNLTDKTSYQPLGDHWKSMHPLARWGGDFKSPDSDHFSLTWEGVE